MVSRTINAIGWLLPVIGWGETITDPRCRLAGAGTAARRAVRGGRRSDRPPGDRHLSSPASAPAAPAYSDPHGNGSGGKRAAARNLRGIGDVALQNHALHLLPRIQFGNGRHVGRLHELPFTGPSNLRQAAGIMAHCFGTNALGAGQEISSGRSSAEAAATIAAGQGRVSAAAG